MSSKRMTANPKRPGRHRPGKPAVREDSSEQSDDGTDEEAVSGRPRRPNADATRVRVGQSSPPLQVTKEVEEEERQRGKRISDQPKARAVIENAAALDEEGDFVTEPSEVGSSSQGTASESSDDGDEGETSSTEEERGSRTLIRPIFLKKDVRGLRSGGAVSVPDVKSGEEKRAEEEASRRIKADALVQEQIARSAALRAAGKKAWDEEDADVDASEVDDTDDLDPEAERAAWKLRELQRVNREREALEAAERERDEVERRRNLTAAEREQEDREFLERQKAEREGRGKMAYMQKYYHKGAFFQEDAKQVGLDRRDIMSSRYADDVVDRELLPQYMQIRDMTRLGRKGRTKYRDLKSEDTGRWGHFDEERRLKDDRAPWGNRGPWTSEAATGSNARLVAQRKRIDDSAPGPNAERDTKRART